MPHKDFDRDTIDSDHSLLTTFAMPKSKAWRTLVKEREASRGRGLRGGMLAQAKAPAKQTLQSRNRRAPTGPPPGYPKTTDVGKVEYPVPKYTNPLLSLAWNGSARGDCPMCYVFDTVLPSRQFDRTNPFHGDKELPLSESDDKDIVDVDGQGEGLMPCDVKEFSYVYFTHLKRTWLNDFRSIHLFQCEIFGHNFLSWAKGDT